MNTSIIIKKIHDENEFKEISRQIDYHGDLYSQFSNTLYKLAYYNEEKHDLRKNAVIANLFHFTCDSGYDAPATWADRVRSWLQGMFYGSVADPIICFELRISQGSVHNLYAVIIPVTPEGKVSSGYYFGKRNQFTSFINSYYTSMINLGLSRSGDAFKNEDRAKSIKDGKTNTADTRQTIKELKAENKKLHRYIDSYLKFLSENGGLKKVNKLIDGAQNIQYAIRYYQEQGNKEMIQIVQRIIQDAQVYKSSHGIV